MAMERREFLWSGAMSALGAGILQRRAVGEVRAVAQGPSVTLTVKGLVIIERAYQTPPPGGVSVNLLALDIHVLQPWDHRALLSVALADVDPKQTSLQPTSVDLGPDGAAVCSWDVASWGQGVTFSGIQPTSLQATDSGSASGAATTPCAWKDLKWMAHLPAILPGTSLSVDPEIAPMRLRITSGSCEGRPPRGTIGRNNLWYFTYNGNQVTNAQSLLDEIAFTLPIAAGSNAALSGLAPNNSQIVLNQPQAGATVNVSLTSTPRNVNLGAPDDPSLPHFRYFVSAVHGDPDQVAVVASPVPVPRALTVQRFEVDPVYCPPALI